MLDQQRRRSPAAPTHGAAPSRRSGGSSGPSNAALQSELPAMGAQQGEEMQGDLWGWLGESTSFGWLDSVSDWWSSLFSSEEQDVVVDVADPQKTDATVEDVEEIVEEVEETGPQVDRTETVSAGMKGAVIDVGAETLELRDGPSADAAVSGTVTNGKPVEVVSVDGEWIEVEFRDGDSERSGWLRAGLFSDQPALNQDDAAPGLMDDYSWQLYEKDDVLPEAGELRGSQVKQGGLADCYFVAAMIAVGNARPAFLEQSFRYNESSGLFEVRFFEEQGYDYRSGETRYDEVWVEVDGHLPTDTGKDRLAYARDNPELWGALMEKAYAKWQGGYEAIGNGGYGSKAMASLTGADSSSRSPSSMQPDEVLAFFQAAKDEGKAIYAGTQESWQSETQTPLQGEASGPYSGQLTQIHDWNEVKPGTLRITDASGQVGSARDTGAKGDKTASIVGSDVAEGEIDYAKPGKVTVQYRDGAAPESAEDLELGFRFKGMIAPQYQLVGWHGYAFEDVVDGKLQFYNPWGSWQPKPIPAEDFTKYFSSCATNLVPQARDAQTTEG